MYPYHGFFYKIRTFENISKKISCHFENKKHLGKFTFSLFSSVAVFLLYSCPANVISRRPTKGSFMHPNIFQDVK